MADVLRDEYKTKICDRCSLVYVSYSVYDVVEKDGIIKTTENYFDCPSCLDDLLITNLFDQF